MFTVISRIIHFGFKNFWRNGSLSTATVAVMVLALIMFLGLILFNVVTDQAITSVQDRIDIAVYFKKTASEDEILKIKEMLEGLDDVRSVDYVSKDKALEDFKKNHEGDPSITQALNELSENPLEALLRIKAKSPEKYATIAEVLSNPSMQNVIDEIDYKKNQVIIDRLASIIHNVNRGGFVLTIIMAIIAGLVVFNTIWIAIYSNREEIGIMRVVGASNILVRGPYMVEGVIAGTLSGILSVIVAIPFVHFTSPYFQAMIGDFNLLRYFYSHLSSLVLYQLLFGIIIGSLSSFLAVRRYLRM